ncbi:MAG: hypothetical protein QJR05_14390 [Thermoanaerobacterium sp.]|nr:hypothetical protein [Thermoanaerobacterium sp.]
MIFTLFDIDLSIIEKYIYIKTANNICEIGDQIIHWMFCISSRSIALIIVIFNNVEKIFAKRIGNIQLLNFNFFLVMKFATNVTNSVSIIITIIPAINCIEVINTITKDSVNNGNFF